MTETATVEVLTAEVRVLMVGSRQVTLSVARQLDDVDAGDLRPFGRITTGRKLEKRTRIVEAIGSHEGVLARAVVSQETVRCRGARRFHYPHDVEPFLFCGKDEDHVPHAWWWFYPDEEMWREWNALPLIVLAGLR